MAVVTNSNDAIDSTDNNDLGNGEALGGKKNNQQTTGVRVMMATGQSKGNYDVSNVQPHPPIMQQPAIGRGWDLAGYVGNMPATCHQLVKMSPNLAQNACQGQHKNDPGTRFLCQDCRHNHTPPTTTTLLLCCSAVLIPHTSILSLLLETHHSSIGRIGKRQESSGAAAAE